jgi:ATP/maltotriose-dependent transcriptional regulator MalT
VAKLDEAGETERVRDRHLDLHLALVESLAPLLDTDKDAWRSRVVAEYPNLRAAVEWGLARADPTRGQRLAAQLAWLLDLDGRGVERIRLLRRAVERGAGERTALQARVLVALALVADTSLAGEKAYDIAREAKQLAAEVGARDVARLAGSLAAVGRFADDLDGVLEEAVQARDEARVAGDGFVADSSGALVGLVHVLRNEYRQAIDHLEPALVGLLRRGDRDVASSALCWNAWAAAWSGDLRRAGELAEQAVTTAAPLRDFHRIGSSRSVLAEVRCLQGRYDDAAAALAPVNRLVAGVDERPYIPGWERTNAMLALAAGQPQEAVTWCRREGPTPGEADDEVLAPHTRLVLAEALRAAGDEEAAAAALAALAASPLTTSMPLIQAGVVHQRAQLAEAADVDRALTLHHEALRIRVEHDLVLGCVESLASLALLYVRRGALETAGILLGAVECAAEDAGAAVPAAARTARAAAVADGSDAAEAFLDAIERGRGMSPADAAGYAARARGPRRRPDSGWESLTPTERTVVDLAVQGLSNPAIASRLFMSRGTVKTHLAHVYAKLQVANRTELARLASKHP